MSLDDAGKAVGNGVGLGTLSSDDAPSIDSPCAARHRLNRGGNRRLNSILHRIVLTQAHASTEARTYLERRITEGKSRREAMRALKRYVARSVWRCWAACDPATASAVPVVDATELKTDEQQEAASTGR